MASQTFSCHIEAPHPAHEWHPLVADPHNEHVLYLGMAAITCPGVETAAWLLQQDGGR